MSVKVTVLCVGKVKESFYRDAIAEYTKRLGRYCKLEMIEVADEQTPDGAAPAQEAQILKREGERILSKIRQDSFVITLEIKGKKMDSVSFASFIENCSVVGKGHITFVIGGSLGLSEEVRNRADRAISFSDMTFPHQLMRVILCEQIYRAFRITAGEPYHK